MRRPCRQRFHCNKTDEMTLRNLVALAVSNASEGRPLNAFPRDAVRYRLARACVGDRNISARFAQEATSIAGMVLRQMDAMDFNCCLPGLGIPSDFGTLADIVNLGANVFARHGQLLVHCLAIVNTSSGAVYNPLHSCNPLPPGGHGAAVFVQEWRRSFEEHVAGWSARTLRARLGSIGGDGAIVRGGSRARHGSTAAAERFWNSRFPGESCCTMWDFFHRIDIAMWRAIRSKPAALKKSMSPRSWMACSRFRMGS